MECKRDLGFIFAAILMVMGIVFFLFIWLRENEQDVEFEKRETYDLESVDIIHRPHVIWSDA